MFVNTDFVGETVNSIFKNGRFEPKEPIFQEFNQYLEALDLKVAFSTFHLKPYDPRHSISSSNGSSIGVYLRTTENFIANGFTANGNWNGAYSNTENIKVKWKQLAENSGLPKEFYEFISFVWVYDFERAYLCSLLDYSKANFIRKLHAFRFRINPEYVFGSSMPSFNIIYKNKKDFDLAYSKGYFERISDLANKLLSTNDKFGMFKTNSIHINFYHKEMPDLNLYGLSRED